MSAAANSARKAALKAYAARVLGYFELRGAVPVEAAILQPADLLLDLYGEDIRARAYTTVDPAQGEMMLRPDFTVPVVRRHMAGGPLPARYCYAGEVFRKREIFDKAPTEALQVGYELFSTQAPEQADAEVFAVIKSALDGQPVEAVLGDKGLLLAAIDALSTEAARKAALRRQIARPERLRALLTRFGAQAQLKPARAALLADPDPLRDIAQVPGRRRRTEILARLDALRAEADMPPIPATQIEIVEAILALAGPASAVMSRLRDFAVDLKSPEFQRAVDRVARRFDALAARGILVEDTRFEASYLRSTMAYYDGFVFAFLRRDDPAQAVVATGGRYDALTGALGGGACISAVGGVIRPEALEDLIC